MGLSDKWLKVARITKEMYDVIEGQYASDMMICKAITIGDTGDAH